MSDEDFKPYKDTDILERAMNYLCHVFVLKNLLCKGIVTVDDYEKSREMGCGKIWYFRKEPIQVRKYHY